MKKSSILLSFIVLISQSCRVIPIQMARVSMSESFKQSFLFTSGNSSHNDTSTVASIKIQNTDYILGKLLGSQTYKEIKDKPQIEALRSGQCVSQGNVSLFLSVIPSSFRSKNYLKFVVGGSGKYMIYLEREKQVYFSSDLQLLENEYHDMDELERGTITVHFKQQLTNHLSYGIPEQVVNTMFPVTSIKPKILPSEILPLKDNFNDDAIITINIKMNKTLAKNQIYTIDYEVPHEVKLENYLIGYLTFEKPIEPLNHLIDLRGMHFVRNDYKALLDKAQKKK